MNLDKPQDKFFKEAFTQIDIISDFLRAYLPVSLLTELDLSSLRRETDSYTDEQLNEHFADLIFLIDLSTIEEKLPVLRSDFARLTGLLLQYSRRKKELIWVLNA